MKKKIKDLTLKEIASICVRHPFCDKCPLDVCIKGVKKHPEYLEMEVEINESNNDKH